MTYKCFVTDFTNNGACSNCGKCCSDMLPLSKGEIATIKAYVAKHGIKEQRHNIATGTDLTCPFRDEIHKKCLIYDVRPAVCRKFICNLPETEMEANKRQLHEKNGFTFMRTEFFGNTEDSDWFYSNLSALLTGG